jgi:hypothetical protein
MACGPTLVASGTCAATAWWWINHTTNAATMTASTAATNPIAPTPPCSSGRTRAGKRRHRIRCWSGRPPRSSQLKVVRTRPAQATRKRAVAPGGEGEGDGSGSADGWLFTGSVGTDRQVPSDPAGGTDRHHALIRYGWPIGWVGSRKLMRNFWAMDDQHRSPGVRGDGAGDASHDKALTRVAISAQLAVKADGMITIATFRARERGELAARAGHRRHRLRQSWQEHLLGAAIRPRSRCPLRGDRGRHDPGQ